MNVINHINRIKKKKHSISTYTKKGTFIVKDSLSCKSLNKRGIEGNFLNIIKDIYKISTVNIILWIGTLDGLETGKRDLLEIFINFKR